MAFMAIINYPPPGEALNRGFSRLKWGDTVHLRQSSLDFLGQNEPTSTASRYLQLARACHHGMQADAVDCELICREREHGRTVSCI